MTLFYIMFQYIINSLPMTTRRRLNLIDVSLSNVTHKVYRSVKLCTSGATYHAIKGLDNYRPIEEKRFLESIKPPQESDYG